MKKLDCLLLCFAIFTPLRSSQVAPSISPYQEQQNVKLKKAFDSYSRIQIRLAKAKTIVEIQYLKKELSNYLQQIDDILESGANPKRCSARFKRRDIKIFAQAVRFGYLDIVRLCFIHNAEINKQDPSNKYQTPLMLAVQSINDSIKRQEPLSIMQNKHKIFELLLKKLTRQKQNLDLQDSHGRTALWIAAENCTQDIVTLLIDNGADSTIEPSAEWLKQHPITAQMRSLLDTAMKNRRETLTKWEEENRSIRKERNLNVPEEAQEKENIPTDLMHIIEEYAGLKEPREEREVKAKSAAALH